MGRRYPINISTKQQLIQTVTVDGVKTSLCWCINFKVEQGYAIKQNIAIQDNCSTTISGTTSWQVRFRGRELSIETYPTGNMKGGFMIKSLWPTTTENRSWEPSNPESWTQARSKRVRSLRRRNSVREAHKGLGQHGKNARKLDHRSVLSEHARRGVHTRNYLG